MQETEVRSLGGDEPLEKEMATHSSILASKITWTEESGGLQPMRSQSQAQLSNCTRSVRAGAPLPLSSSQPMIRHCVCIRAWPVLLTVLCSLLISAQCSLIKPFS